VNSVTWLGHSTVIVDLDGTRLVTDPVLPRWVAHLRRRTAVDPAALEGIAAVLVSHVHYDHLDLRSLARVGRSVRVVVPRGAGSLLRKRGHADVVEVDEGETVEIGTLTVHATHAVHEARRGPWGVAAPSLGFVIEGGHGVYFAGDTDLFPEMRDLGPVDLALLPVAGWGPTLPPGHLDPMGAAEAVRLLRPAVAVPIHWGTFRTPFGRAPDRTPAEAFAAATATTAPLTSVRILEIGESCLLERRRAPSSR
jgi:L-ascorbate metabolism protein UlaG (beta-lactamase superfamily)